MLTKHVTKSRDQGTCWTAAPSRSMSVVSCRTVLARPWWRTWDAVQAACTALTQRSASELHDACTHTHTHTHQSPVTSLTQLMAAGGSRGFSWVQQGCCYQLERPSWDHPLEFTNGSSSVTEHRAEMTWGPSLTTAGSCGYRNPLTLTSVATLSTPHHPNVTTPARASSREAGSTRSNPVHSTGSLVYSKKV